MAVTITDLQGLQGSVFVRPVTACNIHKLNCEAATRPAVQCVKRRYYVPEKGGKFNNSI